jgi:hypothetical protein
MNLPEENRRILEAFRGLASHLGDDHPSFQKISRFALKMEACLWMVLMFHGNGPWTEERAEEWKSLQIQAGIETPSEAGTTKILCDTIRDVLGINPSEKEKVHG